MSLSTREFFLKMTNRKMDDKRHRSMSLVDHRESELGGVKAPSAKRRRLSLFLFSIPHNARDFWFSGGAKPAVQDHVAVSLITALNPHWQGGY
jgi:hypothetical protein